MLLCSLTDPCAPSGIILCFSATVLTFHLSVFFNLLLSLQISSLGANQGEQVGPRSYRTQVQQAERPASWRFSAVAECVDGQNLFLLVAFVERYLFYSDHINSLASYVTAFI